MSLFFSPNTIILSARRARENAAAKNPRHARVPCSPRRNAYYTYGFPIVSHCRARALPHSLVRSPTRPAERSRDIPVTIGNRTMDPSEIAANRPYGHGGPGPRAVANIVRRDEPFAVKRRSTMRRVRRAYDRERRTMIFRYPVRTCINQRYDVGPIVVPSGADGRPRQRP